MLVRVPPGLAMLERRGRRTGAGGLSAEIVERARAATRVERVSTEEHDREDDDERDDPPPPSAIGEPPMRRPRQVLDLRAVELCTFSEPHRMDAYPNAEFANYAAPVKRSVETEDSSPRRRFGAGAREHAYRGRAFEIHEPEHDSLVHRGRLRLDRARVDEAALDESSAALILAGETASVSAGPDGLSFLHATVGPRADRHAPLGPREIVVRGDTTGASGDGSALVPRLLGPHNGSTRATLFAGSSSRPGPGTTTCTTRSSGSRMVLRACSGASPTELRAGSAFRLRPREVHIVENPSADRRADPARDLHSGRQPVRSLPRA